MITEKDRILAFIILMFGGPPEELADKFTPEQIKFGDRLLRVMARHISAGLHHAISDDEVKRLLAKREVKRLLAKRGEP